MTMTENNGKEVAIGDKDEKKRKPFHPENFIVGNGEPREAKELFLFMHRTFRVSRNIRALWFFDHLNKAVSIEDSSSDIDYGREIEIVGIIAKDGNPVNNGEKFMIRSDTVITYFSKLYRLVFVLDLSPSTLVADTSSNCVLHVKLMECLRRCLLAVTQPFNFPGTEREFLPQLYVSVYVYSPFISFAGQPVLIQGILLNLHNVNDACDFVEKELKKFTQGLCECMSPHLRRWNQRCNGERDAEMTESQLVKSSTDRGFIRTEWSLIFMLRAGLLGVQMLPENTQSNIVIITDAVCGMPDIRAFQQVLNHLRSFSVSCSFIQIRAEITEEPAFGHITYPELFHFLAVSTFGTYLTNFEHSVADPPSLNFFHRALICWSFQRALVENDRIKNVIFEINPDFAEFCMRDVVRRRHFTQDYETNLRDVLYIRLREGYTIKEIKFIEKGKERRDSFMIVVLRLPWKPLVFIEYKITTPWPLGTKSDKLKVSIILEAPFNIMQDFYADCTFTSAQRENTANELRASLTNLLHADRLLMHLHSFNQHEDYFSLPAEVNQRNPLFRFSANGGEPVIISRELESRCSQSLSTKRFVEFWRLLCDLDEGVWQKWVHTHTIRLIVVHDQPLPSNIFTEDASGGQIPKITVQDALTAVHQLLSNITTFPLVRGQAYIKIVYSESSQKIPDFFYLIRVSTQLPCAILKVAFLGGISGVVRNKIINEIKKQLTELTVDRRTFYAVMKEFADPCDDSAVFSHTSKGAAVVLLQRPMERILIKYKQIPQLLDRIVRLEKDTEPKREMILHNSIARYLNCSRYIWQLPKAFHFAYPVTKAAAEFILHTILQRRLNEGFFIAYACNGVVNLARQRSSQSEYCGASVEQYVIFPPMPIPEARGLEEQQCKGFSSRPTLGDSTLLGDHCIADVGMDIQLITELWSEPLSTVDSCSISKEELRKKKIFEDDGNIIRALSTLDQLMTICVHHVSSELSLEESTCFVSKTQPDRINEAVNIFPNCFCLSSLLKVAVQRELLLLPTLSFGESDPSNEARSQLLVSFLHKELVNSNNVCIEVNDPKLWLDITEGVDSSILLREPIPGSRTSSHLMSNQTGPSVRYNLTSRKPRIAVSYLKVYVLRLSAWRLVISVLPVSFEQILTVTASSSSPYIPLLVFHCDEPWMAHSLSQPEPPENLIHISDLRQKNRPSTLAELNMQLHNVRTQQESIFDRNIELHWISSARICRNECRVHTSFNLRSYCETVEDQLYSRAFVAAVYQALIDGIYVPQEDLIEATEDRCEQSNVEIDGIDDCIHYLCTHMVEMRRRASSFSLQSVDKSTSPSLTSLTDETSVRRDYMDETSCEREQEEYRRAFDRIISRNFRRIPNLPNYFYYVRDAAQASVVNQNMHIDPSLVSSASDPNALSNRQFSTDPDEVEICYMQNVKNTVSSTEEDNLDHNRLIISLSSNSSSVTCISESEVVAGEDVEIAPLFLNFSCAVHFPNQTMHTFPIDHLPSCMIELIQQCPFAPSNITSFLDQVEVNVDLYVLSCPSSNVHSECMLSAPSSSDSNFLATCRGNFFDFESQSPSPSTTLNNELPPKEKAVVEQLQQSIRNLLRMEKILMLSRCGDHRTEIIKQVIDYVTKEVKAGSDPDRIKMDRSQLILVMDQAKAVRILKDRLRNMKLSYCTLSPVSHSHNLFFSCCVSDEKLFANVTSRNSFPSRNYSDQLNSGVFSKPGVENMFVHSSDYVSSFEKSQHILPTSSDGNLASVKKKSSSASSLFDDRDDRIPLNTTYRHRKEFSDFWLILDVDSHETRAFFCQRHAHLHDGLFELLKESLQRECRIINQELLLNKMLKSNECDSLLLPMDSRRKLGRVQTPDLPSTKLTRDLVSIKIQKIGGKRKKTGSSNTSEEEVFENPTSEVANFTYPPGHFACDVVAYHWFYIHPRLYRPSHYSIRTHPFVAGFEALRLGIERFLVRNRDNLYVYQEENTKNVFYMRLHLSSETLEEQSISQACHLLDEVKKKFENHILLTVHGVRQPGDDLQFIIAEMQNRLDSKVLEELVSALQKNPQAKLSFADVKFIQRNPFKPDAMLYYTLPHFTESFLGSVFFYLQQQMMTFTAKFRDQGGSGSGGGAAERGQFLPYTCPDFNIPEEYTPPFFIINLPPLKGYSTIGVACVEMRVIGIDGTVRSSLPTSCMTFATHMQLYPGSAKDKRAARERFHELTRCVNTSFPVPKSTLHTHGEISSLIQFNIWQVGDVGILTLQAKLRICVQQALCDLITEYGLLGIPVVDVSTPFSPSAYCKAPNTSVPRLRFDRSFSYLRKRSSSDALQSIPTCVSSTNNPRIDSSAPAKIDPSLRNTQSTSVFTFDEPKRNSVSCLPHSSTGSRSSALDELDSLSSLLCLNFQFLSCACDWFDHVYSEVKNSTDQQHSLKRHMFHIDSDHTLPKIFTVIAGKLSAAPGNDKVTLFQAESLSKTTTRFCSVECWESLPLFTMDEGRVVEGDETQYVLIAYDYKQSDEILQFGAGRNDADSNLSSAIEDMVCNPDQNFRFPPQIQPFVPRQHLLFLLARGEALILYLYNYSMEAAERAYKIVSTTASWHNSKARLLREIGLQKMGITHLGETRIAPAAGLIWMNAEVLVRYEFPDEGDKKWNESTFLLGSKEEIPYYLKPYRHSNHAFLARNLYQTFFEDQTRQMLMLMGDMKMMLDDQNNFNRIHKRLLEGENSISLTELEKIVLRSRVAHRVMSPVLLFPRWRNKLAVVDRPMSEGMEISSLLSCFDDSQLRRASGSRISKYEQTIQSPKPRSNTFSTTLDGLIGPHPHNRCISSEDDPCCLKIQFMLVKSYSDWAMKMGLTLLEVTDVPSKNPGDNPYSLNYIQAPQTSPNVWMYSVSHGGIVFLQLSFAEPYFVVQFLMWNASQLKDTVPLDGLWKRNLENFDELIKLKNHFIELCHVHSFTYDFHLRMVATYLVGGSQVLFNQGYNTNAFLIDFLQYYGGRPPFARNCIYEERMEFRGLSVESHLIWEYFLKEKNSEWRVVRLKPLDYSTHDQFMLVHEERKERLGLPYTTIHVILHEPQMQSKANVLNLKFYVILVSHEKTEPFVEIMPNMSTQASFDVGEYKDMSALTDESDPSVDDCCLSQFETDNDIFPAYDRRRFCSGDNIPTTAKRIEGRKYFSLDTEAFRPEIAFTYTASMMNERTQLAIRESAPRRHRRQFSKWQEKGAVLAPEQGIYVHYMSGRQKKLQDELEDSVMNYKRRLQKRIEDAEWHCKRDQLWCNLLEYPPNRLQFGVGGSRIFNFDSTDVATVLRSVSSNTMNVTDVDKMMGYMRTISLIEKEPMLDELTKDITAEALFRFLVLHYSEKRTRYFSSPLKKHLVVISKYSRNTVFVLTKFGKDGLEMRLVEKDDDLTEDSEERMNKEQTREWEIDDLVRCVASFCWLNIVHKPPI